MAGKTEELKQIVDEIGWGKRDALFFIEVVPEYVFRPGQNWRERATIVERNGVPFLFPAPLDILLAKLRRLDEKDLRAFQLVREKTGHPTEDELIHELRASYDVFYLQKNGAKSPLWEITEKLWPQFFGRPIDVRAEIIQPVLDQFSGGEDNRNYVEEIRARLGL